MTFSEKDREQLAAQGIGIEEAQRQLQLLREPSHFPALERPCTIGDGIHTIAPEQYDALIASQEEAARDGRWMKFVPASGAASRMFAMKGEGDLEQFAANLPRFAFYQDLQRVAHRTGQDVDQLLARQDFAAILALLLEPSGLGYAELPKALLKFHRDGETSRTPFEEHLREAAHCLVDRDGRCRAHFTVSPAHQPWFEELLAELRPMLRAELGASPEVGFSLQKPSTDTLALDHDGSPLRSEDGSLMLRPGGHGALLENLNDLQADLVFVKNIDNVCHTRWRGPSEQWIRVLGGYLVQLQDEIRRCLLRFDDGSIEKACTHAEQFLRSTFPGLVDALPAGPAPALRGREIERLLHRPLRVCGVVRNAGEPGGGPFWVSQADGSHSLQIVEKAEVNEDDAKQQAIFASATHFNPVFMALSLRDHHDRSFDLPRFVSQERFILTRKVELGRSVRVLERPGLWNGSMADWNTVFVEVPQAVFSPVKTVLDLLREPHQP